MELANKCFFLVMEFEQADSLPGIISKQSVKYVNTRTRVDFVHSFPFPIEYVFEFNIYIFNQMELYLCRDK